MIDGGRARLPLDGRRPIVVVGAHVQGLVLEVESIPREGESVMAWGFQEPLDGGKSSNQAVAAARLGAPTILVSALGSDERGHRARRFFASEGIDTEHCLTVEGHTDVGFVLLPPSRVPAIAAALERNKELTAVVVEQAAGAITGAACVVCALEAPQEAAVAAFRIARSASVTTILNPAPAARLAPELTELTDVLVPNEHEAAALAGRDGDPGQLAELLATQFEIPDIVITTGAAGASVRTGDGRSLAVPAEPVTAVDTTGAGDAFVAALAVCIRDGHRLVDAARFAVRAATLSVQRAGSMPSYPARHEL
jgi:ribokinase